MGLISLIFKPNSKVGGHVMQLTGPEEIILQKSDCKIMQVCAKKLLMAGRQKGGL